MWDGHPACSTKLEETFRIAIWVWRLALVSSYPTDLLAGLLAYTHGSRRNIQ
jgi:hypothetical protein